MVEKPNQNYSEADMRKFYDEYYKEEEVISSDWYYKQALAPLDIIKGRKLLDIGCGNGIVIKKELAEGVEAWGIDISESAVDRLKKQYPQANIFCGSADDLPFEDNTFDYVTALAVYEHVIDADKCLKEFSRVIKKDGKGIILLPNAYFWGNILQVLRTGHLKNSSQIIERHECIGDWISQIESNNLKIIDCKYYNVKYRIEFNKGIKNFFKTFFLTIAVHFVPKNFSRHFIFVVKPEKK